MMSNGHSDASAVTSSIPVSDNVDTDQSWLRINYRPNPAYVPQTYEERICTECGTMLVDRQALDCTCSKGILRMT